MSLLSFIKKIFGCNKEPDYDDFRKNKGDHRLCPIELEARQHIDCCPVIPSNQKNPSNFKPDSSKYDYYYDDNQPAMESRGEWKDGYPRGAIIHYTAGQTSGKNEEEFIKNQIRICRDNGHLYYIITGRGNIVEQFVLGDGWGYHAGKSDNRKHNSPNSDYIGIEVTNAGRLTKTNEGKFVNDIGVKVKSNRVREVIIDGQKQYFEKFTVKQEESLRRLLLRLKSGNPEVFKFDNVLGHDEIKYTKTDPGGSLSMNMDEYRCFLKDNYERRK